MQHTRLKVTIGIIALIFIEALLKHFLHGFPFIEAVSAQVAVGGWYVDRENKKNIEVIKANINGQNNKVVAK